MVSATLEVVHQVHKPIVMFSEWCWIAVVVPMIPCDDDVGDLPYWTARPPSNAIIRRHVG